MTDDDGHRKNHEPSKFNVFPVPCHQVADEEQNRHINQQATRGTDEIACHRRPENTEVYTLRLIIAGLPFSEIMPRVKNESAEPGGTGESVRDEKAAVIDEQVRGDRHDVHGISWAHKVRPCQQGSQQGRIQGAPARLLCQQHQDDNSEKHDPPRVCPHGPRRGAP